MVSNSSVNALSVNKGSCLCGDITWEVKGDLQMWANCHCSMCRKFHGTAYGSYIGVPAEKFRWLSGEDRVQNYQSSAEGMRSFCSSCGSVVAALMGDSAFMAVGNMSGDFSHKLDSHMFVGSKAPWFDITDNAEQFEAAPPQYAVPDIKQIPRLPETAGAVGGSCLCNSIRYEFDESMGMMGYCHCSRCRRARSAPHSAQLFVAKERFRWLCGKAHLKTFKLPEADDFQQVFCGECGAKMPSIHENVVMVPAGTLDQDPGDRPSAHIYVASRAPWFEITDDLMQFEAMPPQASTTL